MIVICILIIGLVCISLFFLSRTKACNRISCLTFPVLEKGKITDIYEDSRDAFRAMYQTSEGMMRIAKYSHISKEDGATMSKITEMKIEGLFDAARSPYPGPLSDTITCDNKYKPMPHNIKAVDTSIIVFYGYLNNRLQYGTCVDDQITQKSYNALIYCENQQSWYQLELMVPIQKAKEDQYYFSLFGSIACQRPSSNTGRLLP